VSIMIIIWHDLQVLNSGLVVLILNCLLYSEYQTCSWQPKSYLFDPTWNLIVDTNILRWHCNYVDWQHMQCGPRYLILNCNLLFIISVIFLTFEIYNLFSYMWHFHLWQVPYHTLCDFFFKSLPQLSTYFWHFFDFDIFIFIFSPCHFLCDKVLITLSVTCLIDVCYIYTCIKLLITNY
jgi:hypothetical protein